MFSAVNLFTSLAFYGAQSFYMSTTSTISSKTAPPFAPFDSFYLCGGIAVFVSLKVFISHYCRFGGGFLGPGIFDADSLAEGSDEREEGDLEHNFLSI